MTSGHDVIVIGAGHNGLVAAAYLARSGRSVLVLEASERVGGTVATDELAHGCRGPAVFSGLELLHPGVVAELELRSHGLELLESSGGVFVASADGEGLLLDAGDGYASAARFGAGDPAALVELDGFRRRVGRALEPALERRLPPLRPAGLRDAVGLLGLGGRLRGLGSKDLPAALRLLPMSVRDVLDERLQGDAAKAAVAASAVRASWLGPRSPGSAFGLLHHRPARIEHLVGCDVQARGGPGALSEAIASAARAAGADIRTGQEVVSLTVDDGNVVGAVCAGGDELGARAVVSSLDPRRTLLDLYDARWLDPETASAVRRIRGRGSVAIARFVVDRPPQLRGAPDDGRCLRGRVQIGATLDDLERAFDRAKHGEPPRRPLLEISVPSIRDPSLAAEGREVVHVWVQYAAATLRESSWAEHGPRLGELVVDMLEEHAPGFAASVLWHDIQTPVDLERRFGLTQGCLYQAELALDQLLYMRPMPGFYDYATPVPGLYLCGAATHGGGGVSGIPGRNAAKRVLEAS